MKKFFSFVIVMAAVAMVSCGGNSAPKATEAEVVETEVVATEAPVQCDSTACCAEQCDSTKQANCTEKAAGECCKK